MCVGMKEADESRFLIFICLPLVLCIFGGFTVTSLFGTVSTPLQPPGLGKKPFPVAERQREKRGRDRMGTEGQAGRRVGMRVGERKRIRD